MKLKLNMKTRNLLLTLTVAALASINVMATDALLSPRAAANQTKVVAVANNDPNLAAPGLASASPRLVDHQSKVVAGKSTGTSPSAACMRNMSGTPKMIGACADHPGAPMSCCSVAGAK
jgi:hypothetical protein